MSDKRIVLVPMDGSAFSQQILPELRRLVAPSGTKLILLRVAKPGEHSTTVEVENKEKLEHAPRLVGEIPRSALTPRVWTRPSKRAKGFETTRSTEGAVYGSQVEEQTAQAIADSLRPLKDQLDAEGYEVEITARLGEAKRRIVEFLDEEHVDLVAMTTHSRMPFGRGFLGSVARYVLHHASVSVLLVRPEKGNG